MNHGDNSPNIQIVEFIPPPKLRCNPYEIDKPKEDESENYEIVREIPEQFIDDYVPAKNVTVKFHLCDVHVIAQVYSNRQTVGAIKEDMAQKLEVKAKFIVLSQEGREVSNHCLLAQTDQNQFGIYEFELTVKELHKSELVGGEKQPVLDMNIYYNKFRLPDFITVTIPAEDTDDGNPKNIVVEIENKAIVKPFLCGYKDKNTGIEYLDAFSQTGPYFDMWKYRRYRCRDTQTYEWKEKFLNTAHEQASQCYQDGCNVLFVSAATDFTITPRKYQTYAQKMRLENKLAKIILIQRNWRRYLIVRYMKNAAKEYRRLVANRIAEEERFQGEEEKRLQRDERAKEFPHTKNDFDVLYSEVQKWKIAELKRISRLYEGPARIAEVNILLDKEIQLRNNIERQRVLVHKAMQDFRDEKLLTALGKPITWIGYKDNVVHLDLMRTQRARFLTELYKDLQRPTSRQERLELLAKVKVILLDERAFPEFPELFDLVQREVNLLLHTKHCEVEILRKRQNILFRELISFSKDKEPEIGMMRMCNVCKKVLPYNQFALRTRQTQVATCKNCYYLKIPATDNKIYSAILRAIQRDERKRRSNSSFAFVLQVDDIRYIIDQIWHAHSILSKNETLHNLRLPRWQRSNDWSPWNCICLTEAEAHDHYKLVDPSKVYDHKLVLEVESRHKLARAAFRTMTTVATEFVETGQWFNVGMNKQRVPDSPDLYPREAFPHKPAKSQLPQLRDNCT